MQRRALLLAVRRPAPQVLAVADAATTAEGQAVVIDVLANDVATGGKSLVGAGPASSGIVQLGTGLNAGRLVYTPAEGFSGVATFPYTMLASGMLRGATVTVTVTPAPPVDPDPPAAVLTGIASGLRWASGGYSNLTQLESLRTNAETGLVRRLDVVRIFSYPGPTACTTGDTMVSRHHASIVAARGRGTRYLSFGSRMFAAGTVASSVPGLPSGSTWQGRTLASWPAKGSLPADKWVSPRFPVGFQASGLTADQKYQQAMDVWGKAADGHWDHLWSSQIQDIKAKLLIAKGWGSDAVWIDCPGWECNQTWTYGVDHGLYGGSYACCRTAADLAVVRGAFDRRCDVMRTAWGTNPAHPKLLMHFNPHKDSKFANSALKVQDVISPAKWDLVGPDWYDRGATGSGLPRFNTLANRAPSGCLSGLNSWIAWIRQQQAAGHTHLRLGIGEWGCWYDPGGENNPGNDNPTFIEETIKLFENNRDVCDGGYEAYFNANSATAPHFLSVSGGGSSMPNASSMYRTKLGNRT